MTKTINLLPAAPAGVERLEALPSVIATSALMLAIGGVGFLLARGAAPAQVAYAAPPPLAVRGDFEIPAGDPMAVALACAEGWVPWHQLFAALPSTLEPLGSITSLHFRAATNQLEISGETDEVQAVPDLMLFLESYAWLKHAVPVSVRRDPKSGKPIFTVRADVVPPLKLEVLR
ncbi:MAG: PilN domain-containing protein [Planctomycetes bacterium]|nr:PilN domain-containing protein [Planctomycetota bacterium]